MVILQALSLTKAYEEEDEADDEADDEAEERDRAAAARARASGQPKPLDQVQTCCSSARSCRAMSAAGYWVSSAHAWSECSECTMLDILGVHTRAAYGCLQHQLL